MLKVGDVVRAHLFRPFKHGIQHQCGVVKRTSHTGALIYWFESREEYWTSIIRTSRNLHMTIAGNVLEVLEGEHDVAL